MAAMHEGDGSVAEPVLGVLLAAYTPSHDRALVLVARADRTLWFYQMSAVTRISGCPYLGPASLGLQQSADRPGWTEWVLDAQDTMGARLTIGSRRLDVEPVAQWFAEAYWDQYFGTDAGPALMALARAWCDS
jgi:hypothetical protein